MEKGSTGYREHTRIHVVFVEIKTSQGQETTEYEGMSDKMSVSKRMCKDHPAYRFIDNIRQYGSECHVPIIDPAPNTGHKVPYDKKESKSDPEMTEEEHSRACMVYEFKKGFYAN